MTTEVQSLGEKMFMNDKLADVWFVVGDEKIPGHRSILGFACPYFETMLFGHTNEAKTAKIVLKNTELRPFKEVFRFCYTGTIEVSGWSVQELIPLLALAHEYQYETLIKRTSEIIEKIVDIEVLNEVFTVAKMLDIPQLIEECAKYAENNVDNVLSHPKFKEYGAELVSVLLDRPGFRKTWQVKVLTALRDWRSSHSESELKEVLKKVNWNEVRSDHLNSFVDELIDKCPNLQDIACWDKMNELCNVNHEPGPLIELLTVINFDSKQFKVRGPLEGHPTFQRHWMNIVFKAQRKFEISHMKIVSDSPLKRVIFNSSNGRISPLRTHNSCRQDVCFSNCYSEQFLSNEVQIYFCHGEPACEVCIYGILLE